MKTILIALTVLFFGSFYVKHEINSLHVGDRFFVDHYSATVISTNDGVLVEFKKDDPTHSMSAKRSWLLGIERSE